MNAHRRIHSRLGLLLLAVLVPIGAALMPISATLARSGPDYHLTTLADRQGPPAAAGAPAGVRTSSGGSFVLTQIEMTISSTRSGAGTYTLASLTGVELQGNICVHLPIVMRNR